MQHFGKRCGGAPAAWPGRGQHVRAAGGRHRRPAPRLRRDGRAVERSRGAHGHRRRRLPHRSGGWCATVARLRCRVLPLLPSPPGSPVLPERVQVLAGLHQGCAGTLTFLQQTRSAASAPPPTAILATVREFCPTATPWPDCTFCPVGVCWTRRRRRVQTKATNHCSTVSKHTSYFVGLYYYYSRLGSL